MGGPVLGGDGVLYGTTHNGGTAGLGTVYSVTPPAVAGGSWSEAVLHTFAGGALDGAGPYASVTPDRQGILYGATFDGGSANGGVVFSLTPPISPGGVWTESVLHSFTAGAGDGAKAEAPLVLGGGGVLYGITDFGGSAGLGTVFTLTPPISPGGAWTETLLHSFAGGRDGRFPNAVVIGRGGRLYGTALLDGSAKLGMAFSLTPPATPGGAWTEAVLHTFTGGGDGASPEAGFVMGAGGVLYGDTFLGGPSNSGTVFSLSPPASSGGLWTETEIHIFAGGSDGASPYGGLVLGSGGVLYGTTHYGGTAGFGTVFSLTPPAAPGGVWTKTVLYNFTNGSDGANPQAGVVIGKGGVLYGATYAGGRSNFGTVYSLQP